MNVLIISVRKTTSAFEKIGANGYARITWNLGVLNGQSGDDSLRSEFIIIIIIINQRFIVRLLLGKIRT